ncbi:tyrosine-type recombinase/integrase [Paenibacillus sp. IHBB 10380]|uniref:tyrosine-type recombinase/integrase n=1 Tax=Paenibacillus sp. IHBB 10380 TaxID=1566358 RepID=UPI0005CFD8E0|nr:site-specific integrase [Paenibacillus sp. IHBB 10380]AJS58503.1 integrase [Paenibacillus sp. IHBB 10380]
MGKFFHAYCPADFDSKYKLIVFDDEKKPFIPLTEYYHDQVKRIGESSVISYLNTLEPFFNWFKHNGSYQRRSVVWNDEPDAIKEVVRQYLVTQMMCKVRGREQHEGIYLTGKSPKTVKLFLSSIKSFYRSMIRLKMYEYSNPLADSAFDYQVNDIKGVRQNRPKMPKDAGTEEPVVYRRQTDSYFKIINEKWVPEIIGDWDLPYRIYQAGSNIHWSLRDEVIIRFLFETGARISEILELTLGDYRKRSNIHELAASNKGSYKRRVKFIRISSDTLKLLIKYVNTERYEHASSPATFNELDDQAPLFITIKGDSYKYSAFYSNWNKIINNAGIKLNPHKARHWFVTSMLRSIYDESESLPQIEDKKKQLVEYMKWRDPDTLSVYEHYYDEQKFRDLHEQMQENYLKREQEFFNTKRSLNSDNKMKKDTSLHLNEPQTPEDWLLDFYEGMED